MPKIKLDKFNGIYTNIDENDLTLDKFQDSVNISHEDGYVIFNDYKIATSTLPTLPTDFTWETGIYTTLTEDPFDTVNTGDTYDVLVLVARKNGITIERRVYLQSGTIWHELSQEGQTSPSEIITMPRSFFNTTLTGNAFFKIGSGHLKLYLPHDTFWIGRLKREMWIPNGTFLDHDCIYTVYGGNWYIDRLVDKFDKDNLFLNYEGIPTSNIPSEANNNDITCTSDRRLGIKYNIELIESTDNPIITRREITLNSTWLSEELLTNLVVPFTITENEGGATLNPPYQTGFRDNNLWWAWIPKNYIGTHYIIPEVYATFFYPRNFTGWGNIATYGNWSIYFNPPLPTGDVSIAGYLISKESLQGELEGGETLFDYGASGKLNDIGFDISKKNIDIIVTAILDEQDEIIIDKRKHNVTITQAVTKYALKVKDIWLPIDINKRVTRIKFYVKFIDVDSDYELYKEIDFLDNEESPYLPFYLYETLRTGILLSQNISFLFDEDKPEKYNVISGFRNIVTVNNVTLGLESNTRSYIYHSIVGNGVLQSNILLTENKLLIPQTSNIVAVVDINNNMGIITDQKIFMCTIGESVGQLIFEIQDSIEHGISDPIDVIETQNTVIINTRNGIYKTNGYEIKLLSQPINDIIKSSYDSYNLNYNPYKHLLYYYTTTNTFYQFRFDYEKWEKFTSLPPIESNLELILTDLNGNPAYLYSDKLYNYNVSGTSYGTAYCITNKSDLGEASVDKLLNYIDIDYSGTCTLQIYCDSRNPFTLSPKVLSSRGTREVYIPLIQRQPFQKLYFRINMGTVNTRINKLELDFSPLKRKYHDNN